MTFINIFSLFFSEKIRLDVSSESSARQRIHMINQALFSSKDKSKKLKCRLLQFLFGALRVKKTEHKVCYIPPQKKLNIALDKVHWNVKLVNYFFGYKTSGFCF